MAFQFGSTTNSSGFGGIGGAPSFGGQSNGFTGFSTPGSSSSSTNTSTAAPASTPFGFGSAASTSSTPASTSMFGSMGAFGSSGAGAGAGTSSGTNPSSTTSTLGLNFAPSSFGSMPSTTGAGTLTGGGTGTGSSLGGFGTSSNTGFGFGATAATPAFGSMTTNAGFGGGGGFGFPSTGTATNTLPVLGGGSMMQSQQLQFQPQQAQSINAENFQSTAKYHELPEEYKKEIDRVYKEFKEPMKEQLNDIQRAKGDVYDELYKQLKKIHLNTMELETEQMKLQHELKPFIDELKPFYHDVHLSGTTGLSQIRSRGGGVQGGRVNMLDEELPDKFYLKTAEKLEKRMKECLSAVQYFEKQLSARMKVLEAFSRGRSVDMQGQSMLGGRGQYGQVTRVGAAQLILLIKQQSDAFQRISMEVVGVHQAANDIRQLYLNSKGREGNPFEAADRREAAEKKYMEEKIKQEQTAKVSTPQPVPQIQPQSSCFPTSSCFPAAAPVSSAPFAPATSFNPFIPTPSPFGATTPQASFGTPAPANSSAFGFMQPTSNNVAALDLAKPSGGGLGAFGNSFGNAGPGLGNSGFGSSTGSGKSKGRKK